MVYYRYLPTPTLKAIEVTVAAGELIQDRTGEISVTIGI